MSSQNLVALFDTNTSLAVPAWAAMTADSATAQMCGGFGDGRNRIGLKGARFRLIQGGQEIAIKDEPYLDIIMLAANAAISRTFYLEKWEPGKKVPPTCFSADGLSPDAKSESPQSARCATCKQNEKGSVIFDSGKKGRACSFSKRCAVMLAGDPDKMVYQLDVKALSLFGDGIASKGLYTMAEYSKLLQARGARAEALVTRISFDTASSVPKLWFTPQAFVDQSEMAGIIKLSKSAEVKSLLEVTLETVGLSQEHDIPESDVPAPVRLATPAATPTPEMVETVPVKAAKPPKAAKPVEAPVAPPAPVVAQAMDEDLESMLEGLV